MAEFAWRLDHVTIGGSDLARLRASCRHHGLDAVYGGAHGNERTHMAQIPLADGTYVELISAREPGVESPVWTAFVADDGGACGWAIHVDEIEPAADRLRAAGVAVDGPERYERYRPDGTELVWDMAVPEQWVYPILLADRTPRDRRVRPGGAGTAPAYRGLARVLVAVASHEPHADRLRTFFGCGSPRMNDTSVSGVAIRSFDAPPISLVAPDGADWLPDRLERFGAAPISFVLERDPGEHPERGGPDDRVRIGGCEVAWLPVTDRDGFADLGVVSGTPR